MWRAFFLAMGFSLIIIGAECLVIERVVLAGEVQSGIIKSEPVNGNGTTGKQRILSPPDWAPWSMISAGAVVIIYYFTIPARARR